MATKSAATDDPTDEDEVPCPTCPRTFETEGGRNRHHALAHGESLVERTAECENCGDEFTAHPRRRERFCSKECANEFRRDPRETIVCGTCGDEFEALPCDDRSFCSPKCANKAMEKQVKRTCDQCGRTYRSQQGKNKQFCGRACRTEDHTEAPRPASPPMLCWLLYVYEGNNLQETFARQRAVLGADNCLTKKEVRDILTTLGVMRGKGNSVVNRKLRDIDPDEFSAQVDGDDTWKQYYNAADSGGESA